MTKPVHADPRRREGGERLGFAPALGAGSALELPVLFQLSDLSHARVLSPARAKPESEPILQQAAPSAAAASETKSALQEAPSASAETSGAATSGALSTAEETSPPTADSPTIRERAQMRQRRQQAAGKGDWFQTQGKYILVVFLLGLIATIFVARGKDDSPQSPVRQPIESNLATEAETPGGDMHSPVDPPSMAEQMDIAPPEGPPAIATAESSSDPLADVNPAHGADSVSDFVEPPAGEGGPQVTLQAPQAPAGAVAPPTAEAPSEDESLFSFSSEPRVASRPQPEPPRGGAPLPQANPHYPGPPAASPPAGETEAAPGGYPVTDPSTYRGHRSPTPPSTAASGAAPASYERRVPTVPRPSGPRYERTGSGLY